MGSRSVAHKFKKKAEEMGYTFEEYKGFADELEDWVDIHLGNLESKRDWGYAPDYVEGMWKILQQKEPEDFILSKFEVTSIFTLSLAAS